MKQNTISRDGNSLFNTFSSLLKKARNSELSDSFFKSAQEELQMIGDLLKLTPVQCILLGIILERTASGLTDVDDISSFLDTSNLTVLSHSDDLDLLKSRHLIREFNGMGGAGYVVPRNAMECFKRNENYEHKVQKCKTNSDLYGEIDSLVSLCSDHELAPRECLNELIALLRKNSEIPMAQCLLKCLDVLPVAEFVFLVGVSMFWMRHNENEVNPNMFGFLFEGRRNINRIINEMAAGTSPLLKRKMLKIANEGEIGMHNTFCLAPQFKKKLYPELCSKNTADAQDTHLKMHDELVAKPMFYNPGEEAQVTRLHSLLQPKQMDAVLARLKDRKMRGGFSILLYGGPGTGKTETVIQLAKESGRALFVVEMDQMRSKWYGESEKLVKALFDDYRRCAKNSKSAPILFFNEADALFNRRMENAERSVDKGENALQNIILQEMENLDGILIATTNLATSLDPAFERRFIYKLELTKPQREVKAKIWRSMLPSLTEDEADTLSARYDFSGGQIENIMRKGTVEEILTGEEMTFDQWCGFCEEELIKGKNKPRIGFGQAQG